MSPRAIKERLQPWHGGAAMVGLGFVYLLIALISGHEARAEIPEDLSASAAELGLGVYKAAALVVKGARVVDLRDEVEFQRAHLPGAESRPGADADDLGASPGKPLLLVGDKDAPTGKLAAETRAAVPGAKVHFLKGGAGSWYLAFDLPVPLFSGKAPPRGYEKAIDTLRGYLAKPDPQRRGDADEALQTLARLDYQPDLLGQARKPKAAKKRKKISGGCG